MTPMSFRMCSNDDDDDDDDDDDVFVTCLSHLGGL